MAAMKKLRMLGTIGDANRLSPELREAFYALPPDERIDMARRSSGFADATSQPREEWTAEMASTRYDQLAAERAEKERIAFEKTLIRIPKKQIAHLAPFSEGAEARFTGVDQKQLDEEDIEDLRRRARQRIDPKELGATMAYVNPFTVKQRVEGEMTKLAGEEGWEYPIRERKAAKPRRTTSQLASFLGQGAQVLDITENGDTVDIHIRVDRAAQQGTADDMTSDYLADAPYAMGGM
jgi:hypothetical protein